MTNNSIVDYADLIALKYPYFIPFYPGQPFTNHDFQTGDRSFNSKEFKNIYR